MTLRPPFPSVPPLNALFTTATAAATPGGGQSVSLALLFASLDRLLRSQPAANPRLAAHAGRHVRLALPLFNLDFSFTPQGGIESAGKLAPETHPDCTLRLNTSVLLRLALHDEAALRSAPVEGDLQIARDLFAVLNGFDLALALRPYLGDIAAARTEQVFDRALNSRHKALHTLAANGAEYLVHEAKVLAERTTVGEFAAAVDHLREGVDRLAVRLQRLESVHPATPAPAVVPHA